MEPVNGQAVSFLVADDQPQSGAGFYDAALGWFGTVGDVATTGIEEAGETVREWFGQVGETARTVPEELGETARTGAKAWSPAPVLIGLGVGGLALYLLTRK